VHEGTVYGFQPRKKNGMSVCGFKKCAGGIKTAASGNEIIDDKYALTPER